MEQSNQNVIDSYIATDNEGLVVAEPVENYNNLPIATGIVVDSNVQTLSFEDNNGLPTLIGVIVEPIVETPSPVCTYVTKVNKNLFMIVLLIVTAVADLDLDVNLIRGTIPSELGMLSSWTWLDLDNNSITGSLPTELCLLTNTAIYYDESKIFCFCVDNIYISGTPCT